MEASVGLWVNGKACLEAAEMLILQRTTETSGTDRKSNVEVLRQLKKIKINL